MSAESPALLDMPAAELAGTPTRATDIYDRLRHDLLIGRLQPGQRLRIRLLMERYAAGQTPIREALNRLASDGLVLFQDSAASPWPPSVPQNSLN